MIDQSDPASAEILNARLRGVEDRLVHFERDRRFANHHTARAEAIRRRRQEIESKIDAAIARGDHWEMVREEFARDFTGVAEELDGLVASVNADGWGVSRALQFTVFLRYPTAPSIGARG